MKDHEFVSWMADRMVHVYGESPNVDFVHRARAVAEKIACYETTAENYELLQAKVDEQEREIERLSNQKGDPVGSFDKHMDYMRRCAELEQELAALKAQPSGLVPAWIIDALKALNGLNYTEADYAERDGVDCVFCRTDKFNAAFEPLDKVITELASLNSSPVSDGEPCKFLKDAEHRLNAVLGYSEDFDDLLATVNTACLRIRRLEGIAGVADERAAFEAWHNRAYGPQDKYNPIRSLAYDSAGVGLGYDDTTVMAQFHAFKGALALSAPSHGEQVREVPPFAQKVISKLKRFEECASDSDAGGVDIGRHWLDLLTQLGLLNRVQRSPGLWEISQQGEDLIAAAPSAGSQKEQGE